MTAIQTAVLLGIRDRATALLMEFVNLQELVALADVDPAIVADLAGAERLIQQARKKARELMPTEHVEGVEAAKQELIKRGLMHEG